MDRKYPAYAYVVDPIYVVDGKVVVMEQAERAAAHAMMQDYQMDVEQAVRMVVDMRD